MEARALPEVPIEVVVEFVLPHAFDSFAQALELMLLCRSVHQFATSRCAFWEPFLWRRLHEVVIPRLQAAYHRYAPNLVHLLRTKYVMWPKSIMRDETLDVMQAVQSKAFVVEQVRDRWGDLNPVCCKDCRTITTTPWWRCLDCPKPYVLCVRCRGKGESPLVSIECQEVSESDEDEEDEAEAEDLSEADDDEEGDGDEEEEEDLQEPQGEDEGEDEDQDGDEPAEEANEETTETEDGDRKKPKHTTDHQMQLVVDIEMCRSCHNDRPLQWYCKTCLERGFFFGFCDPCHSDPLVQAKTEHAVAAGKRLRHDSTHLVEAWREGVDGVNRWDIEAPHPKLTFAEAWADRKKYSPLFLLKLYSPTFTGYGSYVCFFEDRPSLFEGLIINGCISHGIKYTGWKMDVHVYEGSFGEMEGFPEGKGHIEWRSGVRFDGWFKVHALLGRKRCSFTFADGAKWEGRLTSSPGLFMSCSVGQGLLTLPDGRQILCKAETGRGRGGHCVHLWTEDGSERYLVNRRLRGVVESVDEFAETDFEDGYNEEWSDVEAAKDNDDDDDDKGDDVEDSTAAPSSAELATPSTTNET